MVRDWPELGVPVNATLPAKPEGPRSKLRTPSVPASLYCNTRLPAPATVIGAWMTMECQASRLSVLVVFHDSAARISMFPSPGTHVPPPEQPLAVVWSDTL